MRYSSTLRTLSSSKANIASHSRITKILGLHRNWRPEKSSAPKISIRACERRRRGALSAKLLVLEKAKVMSYKNLVEARAKRVVKEDTRAAKGKGKRGRKRKSGTLEAEEDTAEEDTAEEDTAEEDTAGSARRGRKRKGAALDTPAPANKTVRISNAPKPASTLIRQASRIQIADNEIAPEPQRVPEPQRAPIAQMW